MWTIWIVLLAILEKITEGGDILTRIRKAAIPVNAISWPGGIIPYIIDKSVFEKEELEHLDTAIETWNNETCIQLRPYRRGDKHWVRITDGKSCFSEYMGFKGVPGEQKVTLSRNGCRFYGLFLHELGHVIGLDHEHVRADRDVYLNVDDAVVPEKYKSFFTRKSEEQLKTYDSPYDLQSIMHYGSSSFSVFAGKTAIDVKDGKVRHILRDVYTKEISFWDARLVNLHYHCEDKCTPVRPTCLFPGYVDKFCKCQTPSEFSRRRCVDIHGTRSCAKLANKLECYRNASFMSAYCRQTCGFCYKDELIDVVKSDTECKDRHENCVGWSTVGHCKKTVSYMKMMCPASCGFCNTTRNESTGTVECKDLYMYPSDCEVWAKEGKCESNKLWMHYNCGKSCGLCGKSKWSPQNNTTSSPNTKWEGTTQKSHTCNDNYGTLNCKALASRHMCSTHRSWMKRQCEVTCGYCSMDVNAVAANANKTVNSSERRLNGVREVETLSVACRNGDPPDGCPKYRAYCKDLETFIRCPNVCNNCGACEDTSVACEALKRNGYCKYYASSTIPICRKMCGACVE